MTSQPCRTPVPHIGAISAALLAARVSITSTAAPAQVAALQTSGPRRTNPIPAAEEPAGQEALLALAACMGDDDSDMDDRQLCSGGGCFGGATS